MSLHVLPEQVLIQHVIVDSVEVCLSYIRQKKRKGSRFPATREEYLYNLRTLKEVDRPLLELAGFRRVTAVMDTINSIVSRNASSTCDGRNYAGTDR